MKRRLYGLLAEFESPDEVLHAARQAYEHGYRRMDAYSPFPVPDLAEAVGLRRTFVPLVCLLGGLLGTATAYLLQYWINTIAYPMNVGGRPFHAWPSFIPVTFELTVLFAGLAAFFGMWVMNGLPKPYHPVLDVDRFAAASRDRFFLCIESEDELFEIEQTRTFLLSLGPTVVEEVPNP